MKQVIVSYFQTLKWKIKNFIWQVQVSIVPEFAIKFNRGIFRFDATYGFGWMPLPDWDVLQRQLEHCFEHQYKLALETDRDLREAEIKIRHAAAWRNTLDNSLPGPREIVLSDGTTFVQESVL